MWPFIPQLQLVTSLLNPVITWLRSVSNTYPESRHRKCPCHPIGYLLFSSFFKILLLPTAFQGPTSFHLIQISSFANSTWAQNQGSGWLDDLQIHGWDSDSGTAIFLKPWSKGNFSDEEVTELVELFRVYLIGFIRVVQDHVSEFQMNCECSPQIWGASHWFFSFSRFRLLFSMIFLPSSLYSTACTHFSKIVSQSDPIQDFSCFLHSYLIDEDILFVTISWFVCV